MSEERSEELLGQAAQKYNHPPEPPRERMWARIETARSADPRMEPHSKRSATDRPGGNPNLWQRFAVSVQLRPTRLWWPIGAAAVLLIGVLIGRTLPIKDQEELGGTNRMQQAADVENAVQENGRSDALLRHAVAPYLGRVEILLAMVESDDSNISSKTPITDWAEELLAETRILKDSPVRENEELQLLLDDLELVLVRIVRLSGPQHAEAQQWIRNGIRNRSLLLRLRGQLPAVDRGGA